jgi:hypothetical protein
MSLHKLTAGSGYDYLTRQVAALDATDKGRTRARLVLHRTGRVTRVWVGSGMEGIEGLDVGDPVSAGQMRALFGCGLHPLAELRLQQWEGPDLTGGDFRDVMRLGAPFKIMNEATPFRIEVAKRIAALNAAIGEPVDASVAAADRARIRTQVAGEFFVAEHGRAPVDAGELAGQIAKSSRPRGQTVAGCDRTGPSGRGQRRAGLHRAAGLVHPDWASTGPAGQRAWPGRGGVHPPRQPGWRPGSAHPCRGGEQGTDPRWALAVDRRPGVVQGECCCVGDLQHLPGAASPRPVGGAVPGASWCRSGQAADQGKMSEATAAAFRRRAFRVTSFAVYDPTRTSWASRRDGMSPR